MVYGLMALGLSVIFGVMRVVNFAHGEMMVVGMYLAWMGFEYLEVSPMLSLPVIALIFFGAGYVLQRALISPFIGRPEPSSSAAAAVPSLLVNACLAIAGPDSPRADGSQFDSTSSPLVLDAVRLLRRWPTRHRAAAVALLHPHAHRSRPAAAASAAALVVWPRRASPLRLTFGVGAPSSGGGRRRS